MRGEPLFGRPPPLRLGETAISLLERAGFEMTDEGMLALVGPPSSSSGQEANTAVFALLRS